MIDETGFKRRRAEDILIDFQNRFKSQFGEGVSVATSSPQGILMDTMSWQLGLAWEALEDVYYSSDVSKATGNRLIQLAANRNVEHIIQRKSSGILSAYGTPNHVEPAGLLVKSENEVLFETLDDLVLDNSGYGEVEILALDFGSQGNVPLGSINRLVNPVVDITSVIDQGVSGGQDKETPLNLRKRYYERVQQPATSGSINHYKQWAKEVPGVADARIQRRWDGKPASVKVILLSPEMKSPSQGVINAAAEYIKSKTSVLADVTAVGVEEVFINVSAKITLRDETQAVPVDEIKANISAYLATLGEKDIVRISRISEAINNASNVLDNEQLTINNGVSNIALESDQTGVVGALTLL